MRTPDRIVTRLQRDYLYAVRSLERAGFTLDPATGEWTPPVNHEPSEHIKRIVELEAENKRLRDSIAQLLGPDAP